MYILINGDEVTLENIKTAFENKTAVLVHQHHDCGTSTGLMIDGNHFDTRGQNQSVWQDQWTSNPSDLHACIQAAIVRV